MLDAARGQGVKVHGEVDAGAEHVGDLTVIVVGVPFTLTHAGAGFQPGEIHMLLGGLLDLPDSDTGNSGPYCVRGGEMGSVPAESQPAAGASLQFRISKVQKLARTESNPEGSCEGPEIDVNLLGCVWRTSDYLP